MNDASARQIAAAHPGRSTWLSANAGSGKTKVLTDRVARLLLRNTPPQNILCLTYTKAAASEMQNRLLKNLGTWAMLPDDALRTELTALDPDVPLDAETLASARRLFASAVETPGGLKIQTIHSFCGGLLRRFPLEAGVSPEFRELDDRSKARMIEEIVDEIAAGPHRKSIEHMAPMLGRDTIVTFAINLLGHVEDLVDGVDEEALRTAFNLGPKDTESALISRTFLGGEAELMADMATLFATGEKETERKFAAVCSKLAHVPHTLDGIMECASHFLVQSKNSSNQGKSRFGNRFPTKDFLATHGDALGPLENFMARIENAAPMVRTLRDLETTTRLLRFGDLVVSRYVARKQALAYLDFDDMIRKTRDLMSKSEMAQWVLFRLDGGLDHILVDEAQDTSPIQWDVIRFLAEEFAAGSGARDDVERTIFVVGDKKQSIYSFQGADPSGFDRMQAFFDARLEPTGASLQKLVMEHSFRSAPAILNAVDAVFATSDGHGIGGIPTHIAFHPDRAGRIDLWPIVYSEEDEKAELDPKRPVDEVSAKNHVNILADQIVTQIRDMLETGSIQAKEGHFRKIEPRDIMILVKKRSGAFPHILRRLKSEGLPVAGADRMDISTELGVGDLLSLLSFLALEDDDLSLAEALRSPIFNLSEQDVFTLAHDRGTDTLWRRIFKMQSTYPETFAILKDLRDRLDFERPYELLERILTVHGARRRLVARLGLEAEDAIDQLLVFARTYETTEIPSLTGFLEWFGEQKNEVKRQIGETANLIRVLTTHGAKGLEAPIVILPECATPLDLSKQPLALRLSTGKLAATYDSGNVCDLVKEAMDRNKNDAIEEDRRLLYVAMTRAEQWLIIAGSMSKEPSKPSKNPTWYDLVTAGFETLDTTAFGTEMGSVRRYQLGDWLDAKKVSKTPETERNTMLPVWLETPAAQIPAKRPFVAPSTLGGAKVVAGDEERDGDEGALRRGRQIHALLDMLPTVERAEWRDFALLALGPGEDAILESEVDDLLEEVADVISKSYDWAVFGSQSLSEIPFSGTLDIGDTTEGVYGIIDRLIVEEDVVRIVDFKTNLIVPSSVADVPDGLLRQLGAYAQATSRIYPDREIEVALLWTRTAELMTIPLDIVRSALERTAIS